MAAPEYIKAAAILATSENPTSRGVCFLKAPARHHDIIRYMVSRGEDPNVGTEQGFVTSTGRFVDRLEAAAIAKRANQVGALMAPPDLYSEDLW